MSSMSFRQSRQNAQLQGPGMAPGARGGQSMSAANGGPWLDMFIKAVKEHGNLSMALGAAGLAGTAAMGAVRADPDLKKTFLAQLKATDFSADAENRMKLVEWARTMDQGACAELCGWLGVPLLERSGLPAKVTDGVVANPENVVGEGVLPEVLDGVLSLPRRHWEAAMAAGKFRGVRPGQTSSESSGYVNVISRGKAEELATTRLGDDATPHNIEQEAHKVLSEGVAHEVGHTVDNALPSAHAALCQALGFEKFGPSETSAYLKKAGVGWDADPAVAAKVVELWLKDESWASGGPAVWKAALLSQAHTAVHKGGTPDAASFEKSTLFSLLTTSKDPTVVEKTVSGGAGLSLYAKAKEAQLWGPAMYTHLTAWGNSKAALSDREYCAELYRMAMTSDDKDAVVAAYPTAAQAWLKKVEAL